MNNVLTPITVSLVMTAKALASPVTIEEDVERRKSKSALSSPIYFNNLEETQINKIKSFQRLSANWDGHNGVKPSIQVMNNAVHFLYTIPKSYRNLLSEESIVPTPYGTIVFDWYNEKEELISIEIGEEKLGFFTELPKAKNPFSNNLPIFNYYLPKEISVIFQQLYS
jgi:hypothetical protein